MNSDRIERVKGDIFDHSLQDSLGLDGLILQVRHGFNPGGYKTNIAIKEMTRLTTLRSASSCKQTQLDKEHELSVHIIIGI